MAGELEQNAETPPASHTASPAGADYTVPANLDQAIASLPLERRTVSSPRRIGYFWSTTSFVSGTRS